MNTIAQALPRVSLPRIYALEGKHEFLRLLRAPSFAVPTLLFPPMFYLLFAVLFAGRSGDFHANIYLLATYGVFGVMAPGLFGFGVSVALRNERARCQHRDDENAADQKSGIHGAHRRLRSLVHALRWSRRRAKNRKTTVIAARIAT